MLKTYSFDEKYGPQAPQAGLIPLYGCESLRGLLSRCCGGGAIVHDRLKIEEIYVAMMEIK